MPNERPDVPHYQSGAVEPIEYIFAHGWGDAFCRGNVVKYLTRAGLKSNEDPVKDLEKAKTYIDFLIQHYQEQEDPPQAIEELAEAVTRYPDVVRWPDHRRFLDARAEQFSDDQDG